MDLPIAAVTARGLPIDKNTEQMELNKRRMDFAAEVEADCFMFMGAGKPKDRPVNSEDLAALADVSEEWAEYASQYGLEVCYHIHTNTTVDSIDDWAKYMRSSPKVQTLYRRVAFGTLGLRSNRIYTPL